MAKISIRNAFCMAVWAGYVAVFERVPADEFIAYTDLLLLYIMEYMDILRR